MLVTVDNITMETILAKSWNVTQESKICTTQKGLYMLKELN